MNDPHGFANLTRLVQWRRVMPTINFPVGSATVNWDGGNSVLVDGRSISAPGSEPGRPQRDGAQQGPPAVPLVIADLVDFETSLFTAQLIVPAVGRLDSGGALGGPEELARREARLQAIGEAKAEIEARAAQRFAGEQADYEAQGEGARRAKRAHR